MTGSGVQPAAASPRDFYHSLKPAPKAHLLLIVVALLPLVVKVPPSLNVIISASLALYAGCWRSVKPEPATESLTKADAMRFPLVGSAVLFSLFLAFKFLPKELVNLLLSLYVGLLSVFVLAKAVLPFVEDLFPKKLQDTTFSLPKIKIPHVLDLSEEPVSFNVPTLILVLLSSVVCAWYITKRHWLSNNILAHALSLEGLEFLSLGSVNVGCILLCGLFFYDIFWVFCTPVMVAVAKNFDGPIKLLFPRGIEISANGTAKMAFSMLGLGDIVVPGIFLALMLRMDVHNNFATQYFRTSFAGYVLGLGTTLVVMNVFNAAQPALLYIVPAVLGSVALHAAVKGEVSKVFNYTETEEPEAGSEATETKKDQ